MRKAPPSYAGNDLVDVGAVMNVIWRGKIRIAATAAACLLLAAVYVHLLAIPVYRATAVVMMDTREAQVMGLESVLGGLSGDATAVNTEVEVLRGRALMGRVVDEMGLIDDAEFNPALAEPGPLARLSGLLKPAPPERRAKQQAKLNRDGIISALLEKTSVQNIPLSLVFQITVETETPSKSAALADAIARLYIEDQLRVKFTATQEATLWLTARVAQLKSDLEAAENAVRDFRGQTPLIDAQSLAALDRQLKDTQQRHADTLRQSDALGARHSALATTEGRAAQARITGDMQMMRLADEAASSPRAAVEFDRRYREMITRTKQDADRALLQSNALRNATATLTQDIARQSQDLITQDQLLREAEASRLIYEHFQTRLKETAVQQGIQKADSRLLSAAVLPAAPSAPRKSLILALVGVFGTLLGVVLVLLRERRANGLRTSRDLEALTGRVVLGQIPQIPEKSRARMLDYLANHPTSAAAEAVRNLRSSLLLSNIDRTPKVIAITSAVPGEGKTTLTLALAQNMTAMGKKVLVIEGDIRRLVFGQHFKMPHDHGLLAVLSGDCTLANAVHPVALVGDVLAAQKTAINAADLFSSAAFGTMLGAARAVYDIILIDTPPVLVVSDARIIGQNVDATLLVVQWDKTSRNQVIDALHLLETVHLRIAGLVLGQISPDGMRRYGYGDHHGAYAAYGSEYYAN